MRFQSHIIPNFRSATPEELLRLKAKTKGTYIIVFVSILSVLSVFIRSQDALFGTIGMGISVLMLNVYWFVRYIKLKKDIRSREVYEVTTYILKRKPKFGGLLKQWNIYLDGVSKPIEVSRIAAFEIKNSQQYTFSISKYSNTLLGSIMR